MQDKKTDAADTTWSQDKKTDAADATWSDVTSFEIEGVIFKPKITELALFFAEIHIEDHDVLGEAARDLRRLLKEEDPDLTIPYYLWE